MSYGNINPPYVYGVYGIFTVRGPSSFSSGLYSEVIDMSILPLYTDDFYFFNYRKSSVIEAYIGTIIDMKIYMGGSILL